MRWLSESLSMLLAVALLCACSTESDTETEEPTIEDATALSERPCPEDSELTYENFGEGFHLSWCNGCHSSAMPEGERQNAPLGSDFDDLEQIRKWKDRIWFRSADHNITMPPVGGPEDDDRARLGEWLACGAPSELDE